MRIVVHSAAIQDRDGAGLVLKIRRRFPWLELTWADGGYNAWQVEAAVVKVSGDHPLNHMIPVPCRDVNGFTWASPHGDGKGKLRPVPVAGAAPAAVWLDPAMIGTQPGRQIRKAWPGSMLPRLAASDLGRSLPDDLALRVHPGLPHQVIAVPGP